MRRFFLPGTSRGSSGWGRHRHGTGAFSRKNGFQGHSRSQGELLQSVQSNGDASAEAPKNIDTVEYLHHALRRGRHHGKPRLHRDEDGGPGRDGRRLRHLSRRGRSFCRRRAYPEHRALPRAAAGRKGVHLHAPGLHGHVGHRRLRGGGRTGRCLPAGHHLRRYRCDGCHGRGTVALRARLLESRCTIHFAPDLFLNATVVTVVIVVDLATR
mmetsp:Transcript_16183/g.24655  ORF Transcript_16183/g.24655 Transcript_16183/m.24655 type:complete len:212 (+) Transcript_16183:740-1375(+)